MSSEWTLAPSACLSRIEVHEVFVLQMRLLGQHMKNERSWLVVMRANSRFCQSVGVHIDLGIDAVLQ